jgi:hypothetical protein
MRIIGNIQKQINDAIKQNNGMLMAQGMPPISTQLNGGSLNYVTGGIGGVKPGGWLTEQEVMQQNALIEESLPANVAPLVGANKGILDNINFNVGTKKWYEDRTTQLVIAGGLVLVLVAMFMGGKKSRVRTVKTNRYAKRF